MAEQTLSTDTFKDLLHSLNTIERFNGDQSLAPFLSQVENILQVYPTSDILQQNRIFQITGEARRLVNRHQPTTWAELRTLLIDSYNTCIPLPTLIDRINKAKYRGSIRKLLEYLRKISFEITEKLMLEGKEANTVIYTQLMIESIETVIIDQLPTKLLIGFKTADISTLLGLEKAAKQKGFYDSDIIKKPKSSSMFLHSNKELLQ